MIRFCRADCGLRLGRRSFRRTARGERRTAKGKKAKGEKRKGERQKAKGKRQKAKGKRFNAEGAEVGAQRSRRVWVRCDWSSRWNTFVRGYWASAVIDAGA